MLAELIENDYGYPEHYSCSEKILYGANEVYGLGLDKPALRLVSAFGGGMGIEDTCGALTGAVAVLGFMFVPDKGMECERIKPITREFFRLFALEMDSIKCSELKERYRLPDGRCKPIVLAAARALDAVISAERERNE